MLKNAFQGGFVHANYHYVGKTLTNVSSYDFASSYPTRMVLDRFPMSKAYVVKKQLTKEQFESLLATKCCIFTLEMYDVVPKRWEESLISTSKCKNFPK